jgi:hypothetical protein
MGTGNGGQHLGPERQMGAETGPSCKNQQEDTQYKQGAAVCRRLTVYYRRLAEHDSDDSDDGDESDMMTMVVTNKINIMIRIMTIMTVLNMLRMMKIKRVHDDNDNHKTLMTMNGDDILMLTMVAII